MKKLFLSLVCLVFMSTAAFADRDVVITVEQLPPVSQQLIKKHFADTQVVFATMEAGFDKSYEVLFANGCKVEFDAKGEWTDVDCMHNSEVPAGIVPPNILAFVTKTHPGIKITDIDKDRRGYDVKLNNQAELVFDLTGNFLRYDD